MEPARKQRPDIDADIRPKFGVIQGGGESTPERGDLSEATKTTAQLARDENRFGAIQGGGESTPERGDLQSVRDKEEDTGFYKPDDGTRKSSGRRGPSRLSFKGVLRSRKAASGGLIGLIIALLGGISFFITPGIAAVQMKEILTDDLNDQLSAMDRRSAYVMRAKLNDLGKGVCTGIKIRCGFKGMSDRQLNKFKAAGFEVETDGKVFGRNHVKSLTITDSSGNRITANNPSEFNRLLGDRVVRNSFRKAFNPKFAGFFDAKWDSFKQRYNLTSQDKLGTGSDEEKRTNVTSAVQGEPITPDLADRVATTDKDGKPIDGSGSTNEQIDRANGSVTGESVSTKSVLSSGGVGALKGIGALGVADVACTVKNTARAVEAGAKIYRYRQLIAYSMVFLTFADSIKAGTATPDQAEFVGNTLMATDPDKKVITEDSPKDKNGDPIPVTNKYYGANAFDSAGYKTALYNEAPSLDARDMQMAIGGGVALGTLTKVNDFIKKWGGDNCKMVQNWAVRGGSLVVGVFLGAITLGGWTAFSVGASVAVSMALPILENYLAQMMSGTVANGDTNGVDAGNAIFAGTAALMGGMAMSRGMKPATKSDLKSYLTLNDEIKNEYIAMETEEARKTPFDVNNRYSFVGSVARSLLPARTTSSVSVGNSILNGISGILTAPLAPATAQAQSAYNEERFSKCEDNGYNELGIDADVFCNVRYVLTPYELGLDTEEVRAQMLEWGQVNDDEEGSVVTDSDYDQWLTECTEREEGWGETPDPEKPDDGDGMRCMGTEKRDSYYRVYTMDASIIAAMDYIPPTGSDTSTTGGSNFRVASYNILGKSHTVGDSWIGRADKVIKNVTTNDIDVIGFQEFEDAQRKYISDNLTNYGITTHGNLRDGIMWNKDKYTLVNKGTWQTTYFRKGNQEPWVKLKDVGTGQEFFVMNVHDPINREEGDAATRADNTKRHIEMIKTLQVEAPVVLTGDFNNGYDKDDGAGMATHEDTAYCQLSSSGLMIHAYDATTDRTYKCPNPLPQEASIATDIDHIYISTGMDATQFFDIEREAAGSDHAAIIADVSIPSVSAGTGAGTDFVIATYNQPVRGNTNVAADAIKSRGFDVVGMQELARNNYGVMRNTLKKSGFGVFPDLNKTVEAVGCSSDHAIFYKTDKFKLIKSETLSFPRYENYRAVADCGNSESKGEGEANAPIVWLQDTRPQYEGQVVIVMNTHNIANVEAAERPSLRRFQAAKLYVKKIEELKTQNPGVPIFFTGDFNEGTAVRTSGMGNITYQYDQPDAYKNLLYCMFMENKLMLAVNRPNKCPDLPARRTTVDFIYHTPGVEVKSHGSFTDPSTNDDPHPVEFANMVVPGSSGATGGTGSDIGGNDYARECVALIGAENCTEQCVAFVKFRLVKHGVIPVMSLGDGGAVTSTLGRMGFKVDTTPAVHSVMSLRHNSTGHTAMVSQVNQDGSIVVEEYNWPGGLVYGKRTISAATLKSYSDKGWLSFAHTETKYR